MSNEAIVKCRQTSPRIDITKRLLLVVLQHKPDPQFPGDQTNQFLPVSMNGYLVRNLNYSIF